MAWEQRGTKIRRLTMIIPVQGGRVGLQRPLSVNIMDGQETNEFDAAGLVIIGKKPVTSFIFDFREFWKGGTILRPGAGIIKQ